LTDSLIVYAGSRSHALEGLQSISSILPYHLCATGSYFERYCLSKGLKFASYGSSLDLHNKLSEIIQDFAAGEKIVLISSGVEFKIKVNNYPSITFLNIHPSLLPSLKGRDPAIGALVKELPTGVSVHLMDENFDSGTLLWQSDKLEIPKEFDIRDLYAISFCHEYLAGCWISNNLSNLIELTDIPDPQIEHVSIGNPVSSSYFSRAPDYSIYQENWTNSELLRQIRACALNNFGLKVTLTQPDKQGKNSPNQQIVSIHLMAAQLIQRDQDVKDLVDKFSSKLCGAPNSFELIYWLENKALFIRNGQLLSCTVKETGFFSIHSSDYAQYVKEISE